MVLCQICDVNLHYEDLQTNKNPLQVLSNAVKKYL